MYVLWSAIGPFGQVFSTLTLSNENHRACFSFLVLLEMIIKPTCILFFFSPHHITCCISASRSTSHLINLDLFFCIVDPDQGSKEKKKKDAYRAVWQWEDGAGEYNWNSGAGENKSVPVGNNGWWRIESQSVNQYALTSIGENFDFMHRSLSLCPHISYPLLSLLSPQHTHAHTRRVTIHY